jgi:tetrahydromethanopterin S-methyltransferase subunit C
MKNGWLREAKGAVIGFFAVVVGNFIYQMFPVLFPSIIGAIVGAILGYVLFEK